MGEIRVPDREMDKIVTMVAKHGAVIVSYLGRTYRIEEVK